MEEKKYYGVVEYNHILKLIRDKKVSEAIAELEPYLEKYPYDMCACTSYATLLMNNGDIEKAAEIMNNIVLTNKVTAIDKNVLIKIRLKLLCCQRKYQEAYEYLLENQLIIMDSLNDYYNVLAFLANRLGIKVEIPKKMHSYTIEQILSYSEEKAIEYIRRHVGNFSETDNSCFNTDFPLEDVYYEMRKIIPTLTQYDLHSGNIRNIYVFKYDYCGRHHQKVVDYIKVITIQDTNDIITMYPYDNKANMPYINLDLKKDEKIKPKVKRLSQIEKFNQRYSKNG